ncbi:MAG: GNAT family N-acetyltransferase [Methylobacteriaceae bacterium]|nr:GNAT family N-acetyltransferase [Methylobacteriaceae bacterium]
MLLRTANRQVPVQRRCGERREKAVGALNRAAMPGVGDSRQMGARLANPSSTTERLMPTAAAQPTDDRPILLGGHRVGLALMRKEDIPHIARWNQDLEFTANIGSPGEAHSLEMRQEFFDKNARMRSDSVEFAVILLSTGQLVGFGGLSDISRAMTATLFVGIGERDLWNQGLGTEATRLICEYGFFFRNLFSIKVEVNGYNRRAIRVYERLGFRLVGRLRGVIMLNGARHDQVIMDLLRQELKLEHVARFEALGERTGEPLQLDDRQGSK